MSSYSTDPLDWISRGVITPFRRDGKGDFANASGAEVIRSNVRTILNTVCGSNTTQGEIPWNQKLGCLLQLLRHKDMDDESFRELATYYIVKALADNEPRIRVKTVSLIKDRNSFKATLRITYDIVDVTSAGVPIIDTDQQVKVTI